MLTIWRVIVAVSFSRAFNRLTSFLLKLISCCTLRINLLLLFLVVLDLVLSAVTLFFPATWFRIFHDAPYVDPEGLLRRTGAVWAAFTLFQFMALLRWRRQPYWLPLVAGIRLTEVFSDWVYLYFAMSVTPYGWMSLLVAPPANVLFAWILLRTYHQVMQTETA